MEEKIFNHDQVKSMMIRNENNKPRNVTDNYQTLLSEIGADVRFNMISKKVELKCDQVNHIDSYDAKITFIKNYCEYASLSKQEAAEHINFIAYKNMYNPVFGWIMSKEWDGKDRIIDLCKTVEVAKGYDNKFKNTLIKKWLVSAYAMLVNDHSFSSCRGILVFQSGQRLGKTSWVKKLLPEKLSSKYILLGATLDPSKKDSVKTVINHWIVELGELESTFKRADISRLKAWVTSPRDTLRLPYDRSESDFPRRTVLFASVNRIQFLVDDTGNSRFWVIPCKKINWGHDINVQQMWAQVAAEYEKEYSWFLDDKQSEMLDASNVAHQEVDPIEEMILSYFDWEGYEKTKRLGIQYSGSKSMTATDVLIKIGVKNPKSAQQRLSGKVLRDMLGDPKTKSKGLNKWDVPKQIKQYEES